jgi:hypothetical protein
VNELRDKLEAYSFRAWPNYVVVDIGSSDGRRCPIRTSGSPARQRCLNRVTFVVMPLDLQTVSWDPNKAVYTCWLHLGYALGRRPSMDKMVEAMDGTERRDPIKPNRTYNFERRKE